MPDAYPQIVPDPAIPTTETLLEFDVVRRRIEEIKNRWSDVETSAKKARKVRRVDVPEDSLAQIGQMPASDILIPMPLINTTINQEQPSYINYLVQPNRAAVIKKDGDPNFKTENLEKDFTRLVRYEGWQPPFLKAVDAAQVHGMGYVTLVFDQEKPGHQAFQYIPYDDLLFPLGIEDIQTADYIAIRKCLTLLELEQLQEATPEGLNPIAVQKLIDHLKQNPAKNTVEVFHFFCKHQGQVSHGWISLKECNEYILEPQPLFLGEVGPASEASYGTADASYGPEQNIPQDNLIPQNDPNIIPGPQRPQIPQGPQEIFEVKYPIYTFIYIETEDKKLEDHRGRAFHDRHKQRAQSLLATAFVNKDLRSSNVYAAVAGNNRLGSEPRQLDTRLESGAIYDSPLTFHSSEGGSQVTLLGLQLFQSIHANDTGKPNAAVANRKDSRKTAEEIQSTEKQQQELSMIQVLQFALFLQDILTSFFRVARSRAIAGLLEFCPLPSEQPGVINNDIPLLSVKYTVYPSGDVDVIEREKKIERMTNFWPIVAPTPIAPTFLAKMLDYAFPDETFGADLQQLMMQQQMAAQQGGAGDLRALLKATFTLLEQTTTPEELKALTPEQREQLGKLKQMVEAALQQNESNPAAQSGGPPAGPAPQPSSQPV